MQSTVLQHTSDDTPHRRSHSAAEFDQNESSECSRASEIVKLCFVSTQEFSLSRSLQHVCMMSLPDMPTSLDSQGRQLFVSHLLHADCETGTRAIGGLLHFLLRESIGISDTSEGALFCLNYLERFSVSQGLYMNRGTLRALQVFDLDSHPLYHGSGRPKEGLSLFGILNRTKSPLGASLLQQWIENPSTDLEVICARQDTVKQLQSPLYESVTCSLGAAMRSVGNVPSIIHRVRSFSASVGDWKSLQKSSTALLLLAETLASRKDITCKSNSLSRKLQEVDIEGIRHVRDWLNTVINFPESKASGRLVIATGFSEEIDTMRDNLAGLDDLLTAIGVQEMNRMAADQNVEIPRLQFVYLPQGECH